MRYEEAKAVAQENYEKLSVVIYIYLSEAGRTALTAYSAMNDAFRICNTSEQVRTYLEAYCESFGDMKPEVTRLVRKFIELNL